MKQNKCKEIFKIAGASVLSLGVLCLAFIAGNQAVFAHAAGQVISLPNVTAAAAVHLQDGPPAYYPNPAFTVYEAVSLIGSVPANAISPQAAAEIGSQYIWEVFGVNINGSVINMVYTENSFGVRNYWRGFVAESYELRESRIHTFSFHVDSVSGQRVSISDERTHDTNLPEVTISVDVYDPSSLRELSNPPRYLSRYEALAQEFAERHFNLTEVASVTFSTRFPLPTGRAFNQETSTTALTFRETILVFTAVDSLGREATVNFTETGRLMGICTLSSDIIPGYFSPPTTSGQVDKRPVPPQHEWPPPVDPERMAEIEKILESLDWSNGLAELPPGFVEMLPVAEVPPGFGWQNSPSNHSPFD